MPKINVLKKEIAELIAAGEVVERPASAIKDLVENSIDAGAKHITVEIERGGIVMMRVTDDGCGISHLDVPLAFLRHATSKISSSEDLDEIGTLGFRGEALAAISTVAKVEMFTRTQDEELGTHYSIHGGVEINFDECGCPKGTSIEIRDLFYNTPARMKFLKKDIKEGSNVAAVIDRMALSHPEISFKFIRDGKTVLITQGNGVLLDAVYAVLGRDAALGMIPASFQHNGVEVSGLICKPFKCRPNRNLQIVFLNGRFVKSATVMAALDEGYKNSAMVGKFPYCVINISIPFSAVDVNVHPAKTEVRFADESRIFDAVRYAVKNALSKDESRPQMNINSQKSQIRMTANEFLREMSGEKFGISAKTTGENIKLPYLETKKDIVPKAPKEDFKPMGFSSGNTAGQNIFLKDDTSSFIHEPINKKFDIDVVVEEDKKEENPIVTEEKSVIKENQPITLKENIEEDISYKFIGEAFKTYIIAQGDNKIFFIDKHATHERIIYEKLKKTSTAESQYLITPLPITLPKEEYVAIIENSEKLFNIGFDIDDFADGTVLVRAVPSLLAGENLEDILSEVADNLGKTNIPFNEKIDKIYHTIACKAAVKAGYISSEPQLIELMNRALKDKNIRYCPHGRPVAIEINEKELEKMFGRI